MYSAVKERFQLHMEALNHFVYRGYIIVPYLRTLVFFGNYVEDVTDY